tara:strand:+ start:1109 stop:1234 length:126 start_codon:yes stop_codon:yes gene_type:complete
LIFAQDGVFLDQIEFEEMRKEREDLEEASKREIENSIEVQQ